MKYELELPDEIDRRLMDYASEHGESVADLIRRAVLHFMMEEAISPPGETAWTEEQEIRRRELIDRDIATTITPSERIELAELDSRANAYFDQVAPPPMEGALRLHRQLLDRQDG